MDAIRSLKIVVAKDEIRDALYRYCRGADRCDAELLASVYHPDATEDHGGFTGSAQEFVGQVVPRLRTLWTATQHILGNVLIEFADDVAYVESYIVAYHLPAPDEGGHVNMWTLGARYVDRFERREGSWLIAHRTMVKDWEDTGPVNDINARPFMRQQRDHSDVSYNRSL